jgi:hypothetical protein
MLIIAHRGLTDGPDELLQNHPDQVQRALDQGFDAEIDLWFLDNKWYLGHDGPEHETNWNLLSQQGLWIHCKNLPAFFELKKVAGNYNYFWHDSDLVVFTSQGYVWTYFGKPETCSANSICVMPEVTYTWLEICSMVADDKWLGFCTDWPKKIENYRD